LNLQSEFLNKVKTIIATIETKEQDEVFIEFSSREEMMDGFFDFAWKKLPLLPLAAHA